MPLPNTIAAYEDCFAHFDRAMADSIGVRVAFTREGDAKHFQTRMCQARSLLRAESTRLYSRDDVRYNKCEYDILVVRNPIPTAEGDGFWVYIERHGQQVEAVENLSELEG